MKRMIRLNFGNRLRVKDMARVLCFVMLAWMTSALMFSSCTLESSDNGDLDGFWHLESVDTLATGKTEDFSQHYVFWGVEHKLIAVKETDTNREKFYFRFEQTGDSLKITQVYKNHWHQDQGEEGGDIPVDELSDDLQHYGINALPEGFKKEALSGSKMILKSKTVRLKFKKF